MSRTESNPAGAWSLLGIGGIVTALAFWSGGVGYVMSDFPKFLTGHALSLDSNHPVETILGVIFLDLVTMAIILALPA